jgi:2-polyprenyl-3-methyl-5-hydroxy-6-metoxy-1,4-benzoquinol methylase
MSPRPLIVSEEIEEKELLWWQQFAEVEDRFCWVQTPQAQRILRGHYLREIISVTKPGGRILELGCGTGWLCILLAELGALEVCGIDFSEAQIRLATQNAKQRNVSSRTKFYCMDGTSGQFGFGQFDTVIVHGFLHHLTVTEIEKTLRSIPSLLTPNASFIVFEPIRRVNQSNAPANPWVKRIWKLSQMANRGARYGLRKFSKRESEIRELIGKRSVGMSPHGPSPKEMPFEENELDYFLSPYFLITQRKTCMTISHLVVQEWLLRQVSQPFSSKLLIPFVARLAAWFDQKAITYPTVLGDVWSFDMFICHKK